MEIKQRRHSNRIRYVFGEDELQYQWEDGSGGRSFSVPYTDISRDRQTLTERNAWLRRDYDFMPEGDTREQLRGRFRRLYKEGALSGEELQRRLAVVDAGDPWPMHRHESSVYTTLN